MSAVALKSVPAPSKDKKVSVSIEKAEMALSALNRLSVGVEIVTVEDGKQVKGHKAFSFDTDTTWNLAELTIKLEDQLRSVRKARDAKLMELSDGAGMLDPAKSPEKIGLFNTFARELQDKDIDVHAKLINRNALVVSDQNGKNLIPVQVLVGLMPFLTSE